jgi:hypothetical protein
MKKLFAIIGLVAMVFAIGCTKIETELSGDTLETKVTVSGHARYVTMQQNGTMNEPDIVDPKTTINIYYGVPDKEGNVAYAYKSVTTDMDGFFELEIGCPIGKTMSVRVNANILGESYTVDEDGDAVLSDCYLFGEKKKDITCGSAAYFNLILSPVSHFSEPGLVNP